MKVILVDDEILVRAGMKMMIPWTELGFQIAGEAASATEAIHLAREIRPDLMLVDISMPEMSGLEMIQHLKEELPRCEFIILSCHSEVPYLTEAIRLGVTDYIIKDSLNPDEIAQTLKKITRRKSTQVPDIQESRPPETEQLFLYAMENRAFSAGEFFERLGAKAGGESGCAVIVLQLKKFSELSLAQRICEEIVRQSVQRFESFCRENQLLYVAAFPSDQPPQRAILHRCVETLSQSFDIEVAGGASESMSLETPVCELAGQARSALSMRFLRGWKQGYLFSFRKEQESKRAFLELRTRFEQVTSVAQIGELQDYLRQLREQALNAECVNYSTMQYLFTDLAFFVNDLVQKAGYPDELKFRSQEMLFDSQARLSEFDDVCRMYSEKMGEIATYLHKNVELDAVRAIRAYVGGNLHRKITLQDLSDEIHLSRTYISSLFKKETGMNINDYITQERLNRAAELLEEGMSVGTVAEKVGMQSESYFSKMFKERYRQSPAQYARHHRTRS